MMRKSLLIVTLLVLAMSSDLVADVTINSTMAMKGPSPMLNGQQTMFVKGMKMRTDMTGGGLHLSTILDATSRQMIMLNHKSQEAEVYDLTKLMGDVDKIIPSAKVVASVTPTGKSKEILGQKCDEHAIRVSVPVVMGTETIETVTSGTIWVAKNAPGVADYTRFYKAAIQNGMFFGSPQQVKAAPGVARGMTELHRAISDLNGVPYVMESSIRFVGTGPMAHMMSQIGVTGTSMMVTSIVSEPIADDMFSVPPGWKTRKKQ